MRTRWILPALLWTLLAPTACGDADGDTGTDTTALADTTNGDPTGDTTGGETAGPGEDGTGGTTGDAAGDPTGSDTDGTGTGETGPDGGTDTGTGTTPETGTDADADSGDETNGAIDPAEIVTLPALVSCEGAQPRACLDLSKTPASSTATVATYRKDSYFPTAVYGEAFNDDPVDGGRFHIAAIAGTSGAVTDVRLNGTPMDDLLVKPKLEWWHVYPATVTAGEPVWVTFHSRDPFWDTATSAALTISTDSGDAVASDWAVAKAATPFTWVTTSDDLETVRVYVRNDATAARTVTSLLFNGREVLTTGHACVPQATLAAGQPALWNIPVCAPLSPGDAWSLVATFADGGRSVAVGRVLRPFYPIHVWPNGDECRFPGGGKPDNVREMVEAGVDMPYMYARPDAACTHDPIGLINGTTDRARNRAR